jgi:cardiolipin synthase
MSEGTLYHLLLFLLACVYTLAFLSVLHVLYNYRSAQSAIGWIVGLVSFPYIAVPLYYLLGGNRFEGYVAARRSGDETINPVLGKLARTTARWNCAAPPGSPELDVIARLAKLPLTHGNRCELLIDGRQTYAGMFQAIKAARDYVLLEFYIIRDDNVGRKLSDLLQEKALEGVRVFVLYDDIGSAWLSRRYIRKLLQAGVQVRSFNTASKRPKRLQINFRNHRKILVIDGHTGFVGGLNIGKEYLGQDPLFSPWRDTHVRLTGPAALVLQLTFMEDWHWSASEVLNLNWTLPDSKIAPAGAEVFILPTSAADDFETCELFFLNTVNHAQKRLWIASPYFVPDLLLIKTLQLAALRGVDVRILIPERPDNRLVYLAAFTYLEMAARSGIRIYRYREGFMHQKVMLVDSRYASVGTVNLDNRSLRLNFEVTAVLFDQVFVQQVEQMLVRDFQASREATLQEYTSRSKLFGLACRSARLMAPLL